MPLPFATFEVFEALATFVAFFLLESFTIGESLEAVALVCLTGVVTTAFEG